ncbi:hypothetical protein SLEP1_g34164 [Rubroshorea leprosula]|uniref:Uncharacterized protein n=1 Tax=Rubroshorea leprosula TaxID=152421 RepID=A0AAV5KJ90_9ROSI|nr:hypothetical protein SLEP1_g34164 [Rubroshorea leprosula]
MQRDLAIAIPLKSNMQDRAEGKEMCCFCINHEPDLSQIAEEVTILTTATACLNASIIHPSRKKDASYLKHLPLLHLFQR